MAGKSIFNLTVAQKVLDYHKEICGTSPSIKELPLNEVLTLISGEEKHGGDSDISHIPTWIYETTASLSAEHLGIKGKELLESVKLTVNPEKVKAVISGVPEKYRKLVISDDMRSQIFFTSREMREISSACPPPFLFFEKHTGGYYRAVLPVEVKLVLSGEVPVLHKELPCLTPLLREPPSERETPPVSLIAVLLSSLINQGSFSEADVDFAWRRLPQKIRDFYRASAEDIKVARDFVKNHIIDVYGDFAYVPQPVLRVMASGVWHRRALLLYLLKNFSPLSQMFLLVPFNKAVSLSFLRSYSRRWKEVEDAVRFLNASGLCYMFEDVVVPLKWELDDVSSYVQSGSEIHISGRSLSPHVIQFSVVAKLADVNNYHAKMLIHSRIISANTFRYRDADKMLDVFSGVHASDKVMGRLRSILKAENTSTPEVLMRQRGWMLSSPDPRTLEKVKSFLKVKKIPFLEGKDGLLVRDEDVDKVKEVMRKGGFPHGVFRLIDTYHLLGTSAGIVRILRHVVKAEGMEGALRQFEEEIMEVLPDAFGEEAEKTYAFLLQYFGILSKNLRSGRLSYRNLAVKGKTHYHAEFYVLENAPYGRAFRIVPSYILHQTESDVVLWRTDKGFLWEIPRAHLIGIRERR